MNGSRANSCQSPVLSGNRWHRKRASGEGEVRDLVEEQRKGPPVGSPKKGKRRKRLTSFHGTISRGEDAKKSKREKSRPPRRDARRACKRNPPSSVGEKEIKSSLPRSLGNASGPPCQSMRRGKGRAGQKGKRAATASGEDACRVQCQGPTRA